jgi:hypothetical protein
MVRAVVLVLAVAAAPAVADDRAPEFPHVVAVTATATSTATSKTASHEPWLVLGSDPTKVWCEGKSDEGIGEALVLHFAAPTAVTSLTLRAGVWQSPDLFRVFNRITELRVVGDDGFAKTVKLREERENVDVQIDRTVSELRLEIAAVAKGKSNDTCISGVDVHTDPASSLVIGVDAKAAAAFEPAFATTWQVLMTCDETALRNALQYPFVYVHRYGDAKAVRKACKDKLFTAFQPRDPALHLKLEAPAKVMVGTGTLEWHFVWSGKSWKLASLVDQSH